MPVFQMIYINNYHVQVNGFIFFPGGMIIGDDTGAQTVGLGRWPLPEIPYSAKRIFKYPSWEHPGELDQ
jgi:hypothetical protein